MALAGVLLAVLCAAATAQTLRLRDVIENADGNLLWLRSTDGAQLQAGARITMIAATRKADGTLAADRINAGRAGVLPQ